jgi:hypothetical protein
MGVFPPTDGKLDRENDEFGGGIISWAPYFETTLAVIVE